MPVHFSSKEMDARKSRAIAELAQRNFDAILLFAPESQYWLTGYDTFGFAMFQCMVLTADGKIRLLTRLPDLRQALHTSTLTEGEVVIWHEREGATPGDDLKALLDDLGVDGRIGIETQTAGLTDWNGRMVRASLGPLAEASDLIRGLRAVKSPAEIAMHRKAAELSDAALDAALATTTPGAFEGDILAAMQGAVFQGGGDYAGNEFIIGSGEAALLCRYYSGRRHLDATDQLTLEWSGAYARYHAAMMRTLIVGAPSPSQRRMHAACRRSARGLRGSDPPGRRWARSLTRTHACSIAHGLSDARLQACGYGMGAVYTPIWVDFPMFYEGNPLRCRPGNVFFLHMILMDSEAGWPCRWGIPCW